MKPSFSLEMWEKLFSQEMNIRTDAGTSSWTEGEDYAYLRSFQQRIKIIIQKESICFSIM